MMIIIKYIGGFIKNLAKEFTDIYLDEKNIRESYGDEYADRFSVINPKTGRRKLSALKLAKRIVIVLIVAFWALIIYRIASV
ncbi:MAG: hypothetical protein FWH10_01470 [Oscillospiraceae bacterium]|nr:hypothetical protein [Oscillospiraceae bacterium]